MCSSDLSCTRYARGGRRLGGSWIGGILSRIANRLFGVFSGFPLTDATTGTTAKVIFHSSSQIIVTWAASSDITATGFSASDFIAGHIIVGGALSSDMNTGLVAENLQTIPYKQTFAMQNFFDSQTLTLQDFIDKKYTVTRGVDNEKYLAHTKVEEMFKRYLNNMEKTFTGQVGRIVDPTGVVKENFTMGVTEQIKSYGGGYQPIYSDVTESDLKDAITYMRDVAGKGVQIYVAPGSAFMGAVQTFLANKYVTFAGNTNTFGGNEVEGINLKKYEWLDIELLFDSEFNNFNNKSWYPNAAADGTPYAQRGSALLFNTQDVETEQGMIPFISQYSWGKAGMENRFGQLTVIKDGAIDENGNALPNPISAKKSVTWHVESNAAAVLNDPTKHVYIERK